MATVKKTILLFSILFSFTVLKAQELNPIRVIVAQYPKTFNEAKELADLINNDFKTDTDKAKAIYSWITMNVKYDIKGHYAKKKRKRVKYKDRVDRAQKLRKQRIKIEYKALTQHLALAEGYATLYKTLCDLTGIYGYILKGTGKLRTFDIGKQPRILNHSWNVIQIDKKWFLVDATLGAGTVDYYEKTYQHNFNDQYFFTPPEKFFFNHYPKEEEWTLLLEKTADDFAKQPLFYGEYLKSGIELVDPPEGVLELKGVDSIQFRMTSPLPVENLTYQFSFEKEPGEINIENENDEYFFTIPFPKKRGGYLNLYNNKKAIISYKIGTY